MSDSTSPAPPVGKPLGHPASPRSFPTLRTIVALIMREMQTTYGKNPGGYLWAILEPIGAIAMLVFIFSVGLKIRQPPIGTSFALFYATGFMPLTLFLGMSSKAASAIRASRPLLFYPGVRYIDAFIARFILNFLTEILVFYIVIVGIHIVLDVTTIRDYPTIMLSFVLAAVLGFSVGTLNCFLFYIWPPWQTTWGVLTRPLFLISGVIFIFDDIPAEFQPYLWWNPVLHCVGLMRAGFYPTYDAAYVSVLYVLVVSGICLTLGLLFVHRFHRQMINR